MNRNEEKKLTKKNLNSIFTIQKTKIRRYVPIESLKKIALTRTTPVLKNFKFH